MSCGAVFVVIEITSHSIVTLKVVTRLAMLGKSASETVSVP